MVSDQRDWLLDRASVNNWCFDPRPLLPAAACHTIQLRHFVSINTPQYRTTPDKLDCCLTANIYTVEVRRGLGSPNPGGRGQQPDDPSGPAGGKGRVMFCWAGPSAAFGRATEATTGRTARVYFKSSDSMRMRSLTCSCSTQNGVYTQNGVRLRRPQQKFNYDQEIFLNRYKYFCMVRLIVN